MELTPRRVIGLMIAHWAILVLIGLALVPPSAVEDGPVICPYRLITGHNCIGCGMTRAFSAMLHGELELARNFNPLVVVVFPLFALYALTQILRSSRKNQSCATNPASCPQISTESHHHAPVN